MKEFLPQNDLEIAMLKAKSALLPGSELMRAFVNARLIVPSGASVAANGEGFQPLQFAKETVQMLACFSTSERIGEYADMAPYYLEMTGRQLLQRLPPEYGVVINPGWPVGFDISPQGVAKILADFPS
ncbi:SseB family protein [Duganella rhizosphaerae]|uniref:SseB family protein n=1 Tax=Duganella rhizosphaerae TaxID=2885763 RepID=UPI00403F76AB